MSTMYEKEASLSGAGEYLEVASLTGRTPGPKPKQPDTPPSEEYKTPERSQEREEERAEEKHIDHTGFLSDLHHKLDEVKKRTEETVVEVKKRTEETVKEGTSAVVARAEIARVAVVERAEVARVAVAERAEVARVAVMERAEVVREVVAEHAEVARVNVMRWSHETWVTVSAWTTKTAIRTKALVLSMTTPPRAVGEPDEDLLTWKRCRRCQTQYDPFAEWKEGACKYHPARWECGGGEPFALRHRGGTSGGCGDDCEGRFPCCGSRHRRNAADSVGCISAESHLE